MTRIAGLIDRFFTALIRNGAVSVHDLPREGGCLVQHRVRRFGDLSDLCAPSSLRPVRMPRLLRNSDTEIDLHHRFLVTIQLWCLAVRFSTRVQLIDAAADHASDG